MNNFSLKLISDALSLASIAQSSIKLRNNNDNEINHAITLVLDEGVLKENPVIAKSKIKSILTQLKSATFSSELANREYIETNRRLNNPHFSQLYPNIFKPYSTTGKIADLTDQPQLNNQDKEYLDLVKTSVIENRKTINAIIIELVSYLSSVKVEEKA